MMAPMLILTAFFPRSFLPLILKPTRICASTASLIDHMFTNNIVAKSISGIIITDVADHFGTFYITNNKTKKYTAKTLKHTFGLFQKKTFVPLKLYYKILISLTY